MSDKTRNTLTMAQRIKLADVLRTRYTTSGLNDAEFAKEVSEELGTEVSPASVSYTREALGIRNNVALERDIQARQQEEQQRALALVPQLLERIERLEATVATLVTPQEA